MYYKIFIPKEKKLNKKSILYGFNQTESKHMTPRGENKEISLHCKYNIKDELDKFNSEDIDIYLKVDEETENVKQFVLKYGFGRVDALPKDVKHILGFDYPTIIALDMR
jgi:hypothetical protein